MEVCSLREAFQSSPADARVWQLAQHVGVNDRGGHYKAIPWGSQCDTIHQQPKTILNVPATISEAESEAVPARRGFHKVARRNQRFA